MSTVTDTAYKQYTYTHANVVHTIWMMVYLFMSACVKEMGGKWMTTVASIMHIRGRRQQPHIQEQQKKLIILIDYS